MLFNADRRVFESYKERNLYYKFFAGYFFNELIPGYGKRLRAFVKLIDNELKAKPKIGSPDIILSPKSTYVSFDNHLIQFKGERNLVGVERVDRGEFADILVRDLASKHFVAIEAKYLSNWDKEKDIERNRSRIIKAKNHLGAKSFVQCLLIPRTIKQKTNPGAFGEKIVVLTWEELLGEISETAVAKWLQRQLIELPAHRQTIRD